MRVTLTDGTEVRINFKREETFKNITLVGPYNMLYDIKDAFNGVETTCYGKLDNGDILFEATTRHHEEDRFTKAEGRRRSLAKAMKRGNISDEDRILIWNQYFATHSDMDKLCAF